MATRRRLELAGRNLLASGQPPPVRLDGKVLSKVVIEIAGVAAGVVLARKLADLLPGGPWASPSDRL